MASEFGFKGASLIDSTKGRFFAKGKWNERNEKKSLHAPVGKAAKTGSW